MAVYVDPLFKTAPTTGWGYRRACHLYADSLEELHRFARRLGLRRSWMHDGSMSHYDLTEGMRTRAIRLGAIAQKREEAVETMRQLKTDVTRENAAVLKEAAGQMQ